TAQEEKLAARLAEQEHALEQTRQKRATLQNRLTSEQERHRDLAGELRKAQTLFEKLKEYERQETGLARLEEEIARLPADPARELRQAQETHDRLALLAPAVVLLTRFHAQREELKQARSAAGQREADRQAVQARGEKWAAEVERLRPQVS